MYQVQFIYYAINIKCRKEYQNILKATAASAIAIYTAMGKKYPYAMIIDFTGTLCRLVNKQLPFFASTKRNLKKIASIKYNSYNEKARANH